MLRNLFGPSQTEVWRRLAQETGAHFVEGGFFAPSKVVVKVKEWTLTLDTWTDSSNDQSTTYTRMRAPYVNADGFRFTLYNTNFLIEFAKKFGFEDITIGDPLFDGEFVIRGQQPEKVKALLSHAPLRQLISAQPQIHLEIKDDEGWFGGDFPEGVDELYFQVPGVIKDLERLKSLFMLFAVTLNCLCHIGSAYENDPGIRLK